MRLKSMKREYKYTLSLLSIFLTTLATFYLLFKKYSYETLSHFIQSCQQFFSIIWPLNIHTIGFILLGFVALLSLIFVSLLILSYIKFHLKLKKYHGLQTNVPLRVKKTISKVSNPKLVLLIESELPIALCYGFLKPKIYISTGLVNSLTDHQIEAVLLHELHHFKNKHMLFNFVNELLASLMFFFPLLKDTTKSILKFFETEADSFVVEFQKTDKYLKEAQRFFTENSNNFGLALVPSFASYVIYAPEENAINHKHLIRTVVSAFFLFALLLLPSNALADNHTLVRTVPICGNNQCSTHCISDLDGKTEIVSSPLNYTPVALR